MARSIVSWLMRRLARGQGKFLSRSRGGNQWLLRLLLEFGDGIGGFRKYKKDVFTFKEFKEDIVAANDYIMRACERSW